jgi:hypothetical protein
MTKNKCRTDYTDLEDRDVSGLGAECTRNRNEDRYLGKVLFGKSIATGGAETNTLDIDVSCFIFEFESSYQRALTRI